MKAMKAGLAGMFFVGLSAVSFQAASASSLHGNLASETSGVSAAYAQYYPEPRRLHRPPPPKFMPHHVAPRRVCRWEKVRVRDNRGRWVVRRVERCR